eukprot:164273-Hanusia_phi.AAC.1
MHHRRQVGGGRGRGRGNLAGGGAGGAFRNQIKINVSPAPFPLQPLQSKLITLTFLASCNSPQRSKSIQSLIDLEVPIDRVPSPSWGPLLAIQGLLNF